MFETCKRGRNNDNAKDEQNAIGFEVSNVKCLKTDTLKMSAEHDELLAVQVCAKSTVTV